tara:strand:- start:2072 stop:2464 length:393 start_codon:yes stop_codon:yes gene_type:complete
MAFDDDVKISINLNKLVETRAKLLTQYEDYSNAVATGEYLDENDVDRIAVQLRETLTWDALYFMVDGAILDYMGLKNPNKPHYGERSIETVELTMEKERKAREKEFKKNFDLVKLESSAWTIEVPVRKKK